MTVPRIAVNVVSESAFTVQGHGVHSAFDDAVRALRTLAGVDVTTNDLRRRDVVHAHTVGPLSALMVGRARRAVVTAHITPDSLAGSVTGGRVLGCLWRRYLAWFYNRADVVVALHDGQEAELRRSGVRSPIVALPSAVRPVRLPSRAEARATLGLEPDEPVVLSVGQIQPRKAVAAFHRAAAELPYVRFVWVGGFPFGRLTAGYRTMRTLVRERPLNVVHAGQVDRDVVSRYYAAADVYLHPSHQEHAPIAVFEAAAARLPLVLRDIDCYRHLYPDRYLAAGDDSFAERIGRLLTDRTLHREMSERAAGIAGLHSAEAGAAALTGLYQSLVALQGVTT